MLALDELLGTLPEDEPLDVLDERSEEDVLEEVVLELLLPEEGISLDVPPPLWQAVSETAITDAVKTESKDLNLIFIRFSSVFIPRQHPDQDRLSN